MLPSPSGSLGLEAQLVEQGDGMRCLPPPCRDAPSWVLYSVKGQLSLRMRQQWISGGQESYAKYAAT